MQHIGEGTLAIPDDWHNATVNIYTAQPPGTRGTNITVNRDLLPFGTTLADYVSAQGSNLKEQLPQYKLLNEGTVSLGEDTAHMLEFTWLSQDAGEVHQLLMTIANGSAVLNFAGTSNGKMSDSQRQQILDVLKSFRLNSPASPLPAV